MCRGTRSWLHSFTFTLSGSSGDQDVRHFVYLVFVASLWGRFPLCRPSWLDAGYLYSSRGDTSDASSELHKPSIYRSTTLNQRSYALQLKLLWPKGQAGRVQSGSSPRTHNVHLKPRIWILQRNGHKSSGGCVRLRTMLVPTFQWCDLQLMDG